MPTGLSLSGDRQAMGGVLGIGIEEQIPTRLSEHPGVSSQEEQYRPWDTVLPNIQLLLCILVPPPSGALRIISRKRHACTVPEHVSHSPGDGPGASGVQAGPLRKQEEPPLKMTGQCQDMSSIPQGRHF